MDCILEKEKKEKKTNEIGILVLDLQKLFKGIL